jgi:hypothetical protein
VNHPDLSSLGRKPRPIFGVAFKPSYTVTDLGAGFTQFDSSSAFFSAPDCGLNENGDAVFTATAPAGTNSTAYHAVIFRAGAASATPLATDVPTSYGGGINAAGAAAISVSSGGTSGPWDGRVASVGSAPVLLSHTPHDQGKVADINDSNQVVGVLIRNDSSENNSLPTTWSTASPSSGTQIFNGNPHWNTANGYATAINNQGLISGYYTENQSNGAILDANKQPGRRHAWVKLPGGALHNDLFDPQAESWATGVNEDNVVVGGWYDPSEAPGVVHAWVGIAPEWISDLPTAGFGVPDAINKNGVIVGGSGDALIWYPLSYRPSQFQFRYRSPVSLNSLVALPGVRLTRALCINNKGQILCQGYDQSAGMSVPFRMYLLTPIPSRFVIP